jgi:nucleoid DNA-binding protein
MTQTEIIEMLAEGVGSSIEEAHGFVSTFIDIVISRLDAGDEVKIRGLGTFKWVDAAAKRVPARAVHHDGSTEHGVAYVPAGKKLKFIPATKLRKRRPMPEDQEDGFNKYAVVTEEPDHKQASNRTARICPICGRELDSGGACPVHGTEPFEPHDE